MNGINGQSILGVLFGSSSLVIANNAPGWMRLAGKIAHVFVGDAVGVCDGVADNVEMQAAISAVPAGGGKVGLSGGTFDIAAVITIAGNNITLEGMGQSTVLTANAALVTSVVLVTGDYDIVRSLTINGNKAARALSVDDHGIHLQGSDNSKVIENYVYDIPTWGIALTDTSTGNLVKGNTVKAATHNNIILRGQATVHNIVEGNISLDAGSDGIDLFEGASYNTISGNTIDSPVSNGIIVHPLNAGAAGERAYNNTITGNVITNSGGNGINIQNAYHQVIIGNSIYNTTGVAIYVLDGSLYSSISGNTVNTAVGGIYISAVSTYTVVCGNNVYSCSTIGIAFNSSYGTYDGNVIVDCAQGMNTAGDCDQNVVSNNVIKNSAAEGIYFQGGGATDDNLIIGNQIQGGTRAIRFSSPGVRNVIQSNIIRGASVLAIVIDANTDQLVVVDNDLRQNTGTILVLGTNLVIRGNQGYIAAGEVRSAAASLTAGVANAIGFAWHNPETADILIKKVVVEVTTSGGTIGSHLDVGIADDAAGTNRGVEFFDDLLLNNAQIDDSWVGGDGGTQAKGVFCQDSASAVDGWIVGQILDADAAALVGKFYIEYVGR